MILIACCLFCMNEFFAFLLCSTYLMNFCVLLNELAVMMGPSKGFFLSVF